MLSLLLSYTQTLFTQVAQTAICNRHHSIEQQLCRVLLQSFDRVHGDELEVTHENLATMLGVRRESVTEAAGRMKSLGLIECRRGRLKILDRPGLEALCCECYSVVKAETDRLLPRSTALLRWK
jgi:CRP-like cAMP-binding protein